eukprot:TRINITY_DN985_c0_g1_i2.p1 TRINITY_DN985_c0_g1~~TRINITY_DN985_c0_g1_i2.p1  ORF type:complete len:258 (-),score=35.71 TRINITY_DN985_c0_g1_i2:659-1432(-)
MGSVLLCCMIIPLMFYMRVCCCVLIVLGSRGRIHIYDAKRGDLLGESGFSKDNVIHDICHVQRNVIGVARKDGEVNIWDLRNTAPTLVFRPQESQSMEAFALKMIGDNTLMTGYSNGTLAIYDKRNTGKLLKKLHLPSGILSIDKSNILPLAMATTAASDRDSNGSIFIIDVQSMNITIEQEAHWNSIWSGRFHPSKKQIVTAGGNGDIIHWTLKNDKLEKVSSQFLSDDPVIHLEYHKTKPLLYSLSLDNKIEVNI